MTSYKTTLTKMMRQTLTALAALLMVGCHGILFREPRHRDR